MARWQLMQKHYLNVDGTEWEYKETTDRGRQVRKVHQVPLYLDPENPGDHNYPGMIVVASEFDPKFPADIVFTGEPTPDMLPLDAAAESISAEYAAKWRNPIDTVDVGSGEKVISDLGKELAAARSSQPAGGVSQADFAKLQEQVAALMARNAELEAAQPTARRA